MEYAIITHGTLIDKETIRLDEPLPAEFKKVKVMIEPENHTPKLSRRFGAARGEITIPPEFDEPLDDFKDYTK